MKILPLALALTLPLGAWAERIAVTPGSLGVSVSPSSSATTLELEGSINAADLNWIADNLPSLTALDLSGVTIEAYSGKRLSGNLTKSPAGVLPAHSLSGLKAKKLTLPASITVIADGALMGAAVETMAIPAGVDSIGRGAFAGSSLKEITVPATATRLGSHIFDACQELTKADFEGPAVPAATFRGCTSLSDVTLAPSLTVIGADAFNGCSSLTSIAIPASVKSLGDRAFSRSGLTAVNLTDCTALRTVGDEAFAHCADLESAQLPAECVNLGKGVFFEATALQSVTLPNLKVIPMLTLKGASAITDASELIHEGTDSIGALAFSGMSQATKVTVPGSVKHIDTEAFGGWVALTEIEAKELKEVPTLGENVWDGVEQSNATLHVDPSMEQAFLAAPQWREFAISTSGTTNLGGDLAALSLKVMFEGDNLLIKSGKPFTEAVLYSIDGQMVAAVNGDNLTEAVIDTSSRVNPLFILTITFDDSTRGSLKLLRK